MKTLVRSFIFALAFFAAPRLFADSSAAERYVTQIVEMYQTESMQKFGKKIQLTFYKGQSLQAIGGFNGDKVVIDVFGGILQLPKEQIAFVTCHELGHIFGSVPLGNDRPDSKKHIDPRNHVEGEGDYFGGKCLARLAEIENMNPDLLFKGSVAFLQSIYRRPIKDLRTIPDFNGIDKEYPDFECRVLSVGAGMLDKPRPKCWYNPR